MNVWLTALQFVNESIAILSRTGTPGQGTALSSLAKRECLREAVSRYRAEQALPPKIL